MQIILEKGYTIRVENGMSMIENLIRNQNMRSTWENTTISLIDQ